MLMTIFFIGVSGVFENGTIIKSKTITLKFIGKFLIENSIIIIQAVTQQLMEKI